MQILMAEAAYLRLKDRLAVHPGLDVLCLASDGAIKRGDTLLAEGEADPEVFWAGRDIFFAGQFPAFVRRIHAGTKGRWLQVLFAGLDNPVFRGLIEKGLRVTKSDAQAPAIAEYVVAHAISLMHPIARQAAQQQAHVWKRVEFREIASSHVLLVGYGNIGRRIAERFRPFGPRISVVRRSPGSDPHADAVAAMDALPRLLPEADLVVLCCALNDDTRDLADEAFFRAMKPGAILVNIGRGALVDEAALRAGLDRDQPAHAVLDVFRAEPLAKDSWLWDHPKVRVTAHTSNAGDGVSPRGDELFLDNLARYVRGAPLRNEARPDEVGL
ncbi:MAG: D-2-hydroxyacid dehydrogenase [Alphaproteobacteria bacterium]|nr:D-2-hydroxyacid dehydrogenase [Alphaproteobacteria bacterium]